MINCLKPNTNSKLRRTLTRILDNTNTLVLKSPSRMHSLESFPSLKVNSNSS